MRLEDKEIEAIVAGGGDKGFALNDLNEMFARQKAPLFLLAAAVFLLGIGLAMMRREEAGQSLGRGGGRAVFETERRDAPGGKRAANANNGPVLVDVAGAVEKPGVYELAAGARVKDGLVAAGGLAAGADRVFVAREINLAAPVADGAKIYIPAAGEIDKQEKSRARGYIGSGKIAGASTNNAGPVNINTASAGELEQLSGIGAVRARKIIAKRPYAKVEELRTKGVLGAKTLEKIRDEITVY